MLIYNLYSVVYIELSLFTFCWLFPDWLDTISTTILHSRPENIHILVLQAYYVNSNIPPSILILLYCERQDLDKCVHKLLKTKVNKY